MKLTFPAAAFALSAVTLFGQQPGNITLIHGIPNLNVSVSVEGAGCKAVDFRFGNVAAPLPVLPGTYRVSIHPGANCTAAPVEGFANIPLSVTAGEDVTVVAHLTAGGTPTLSRFTNPASAVVSGRARVVVHHTAAAPDVDVVFERAGGRSAQIVDFANQAGGASPALAELKAGDWTVSVKVAGTDVVALGPLPVNLEANKLYLIYAIGSVAGNNLDVRLVVKSLPMAR